MASKLFHISPHQAESQIEISLREAFQLLETQLRVPFSLKIPSPSEYLELNRAIVYGILSEPHFANIHFTHLNAIVTDGYTYVFYLILKLVYESYSKLLEPVKVNLIWVTSKLVEVSAIGTDNLLAGLLRQIVGGDISDGNLWLCMELLKLCLDKFEILLEEPLILTSALYTYLRLLADHCRLANNRKLENLKKLEINFCVRMLRMHFQICSRIGRDLVRLLQDLVYVSEFCAIWKDLVSNPLEFRTPEFSDISQLYCLRTSSRYFLVRISPEMETQLRFLLTHVRWRHQKRYQEWFARKFFCRDEAEESHSSGSLNSFPSTSQEGSGSISRRFNF
ncbi:integrator complex subunit 3-like isoform X2 [Papaver somniferum]|uniref:integrator complex subunit 3-like isoform X2 n=1 Tax=Papaver somniferum TaxID=3469 RepID=UPI000E6FC3AD|nr:integrator complex subunit 3-like isoform X2 [Papaver somniferum]